MHVYSKCLRPKFFYPLFLWIDIIKTEFNEFLFNFHIIFARISFVHVCMEAAVEKDWKKQKNYRYR